MPGTLVLLPNSLGGSVQGVLPPIVEPWVQRLDGLIAESERGGRRYLEQFQGLKHPPRMMPIAVWNDPQQREDLTWFLEPLLQGEHWGFVSDAGMPCIADPGARLVARARELNLEVVVLPGPSAPLMALLLSGLPSQQFCFHGYPPKEPTERAHWVDRCVAATGTHLCIEAPYRNRALLETLLERLPVGTKLCVALDLMQPSQEVWVRRVEEWGERQACVEDRPAVFLFHAKAGDREPLPRGGPVQRRSHHGGRGRGR